VAEKTLELLIRLAGENASLKAAITGSQRDIQNLGKSGADAGKAIDSGLSGATASMKRLAVQVTAGYLSFQGLRSVLTDFVNTAVEFERARVQLNSLFGDAAKGEEAFAWVKQFATDTPFELQGVLTAFQTLKNFGLDPMGGAMQAVADQASRFGGTQVQLQGISLALGQAWARQKLQGQDILQLINQGVPVWELLGKVTGKTTAELNKMSEAGELGQEVITKFIAAMGEAASGAALAQMETFGGKVSNVKDAWAQFLDQVAQTGALDEMKNAVDDLLNSTGDLADSGDLDSFAAQVGTSLASVIGLARDVASVVASMGDELRLLAELWVAGKVIAYADGLRRVQAEAAATAAATRQLQAATAAEAAASLSAAQSKTVAADAARIHATMLVAEAEAAVASASGMARLATAQAQLLPARERLTAATAQHNAALMAEAAAARAAQTAFTGAAGAATAAAGTTVAASRIAGIAVGTFGGALASLGRLIAILPMLILIDQLVKLGLVAVDHRNTVRGIADEYEKFARKQRQAIDQSKEFAEEQVKSADELAALTKVEQDEYAKRITAAQAYWKAVFELESRRPDGDRELAERANREVRAYGKALADLKPVLDERARVEQDAIDKVEALRTAETEAIATELSKQKKLYEDANKAVESTLKEREALTAKFAEIQENIRSGPPRKIETSLDVLRTTANLRSQTAATGRQLDQGGSTRDAAAQADRIIKQATEAAEAVQALVEGGKLTRGVGGQQVAELEKIAQAASKIKETAGNIDLSAAKASIDGLVTSAKVLESLKVGFDTAQTITDAQALRAAMEAELAANPIVVKVVLDKSAAEGAQIIKDATVTVPGKAGGGIIPGSSPTPTADNILIRATAGEFMQPVSTVKRYGLDVMEALRSGRVAPERIQRAIRGYAIGGLISPSLSNLPAVPSAASAAPPPPGATTSGAPMGVIVLQSNGQSFRATMPRDDADSLMRTIHHEALKTGARKPR